MTNRRRLLQGAAAFAAGAALPAAVLAAAPMLGTAPASVHRYKLGGFEITAILDGSWTVEKPETIFGVNQKPEDVAARLQANFLPADKMAIVFTPIVVNTAKELILFDTGRGGANGGQLAALLGAAGFSPETIDIVVISHCHPDHIGGAMAEGKPLYPNARYVMGETEYAFWSAPERLSGATEGAAKLVQSNVVPLRDKMTFVKNEAEIAGGIRAIEAFGHTPGHLTFHLENEGARLLIGADFCNHFVLSMQRPDWHVKFDADKEGAAATRVKLLDMLAADRIPYTGYHMPFPSVGYVEKATVGGYRFVPATYQLTL
jgi:glyoxylase-like metal-dependent hydrolase (beta-lactamase superfamily II)